MVTHHLADILPEITRVIMMRSGRIVSDGPKDELITRKSSAISSASMSPSPSETATGTPGKEHIRTRAFRALISTEA